MKIVGEGANFLFTGKSYWVKGKGDLMRPGR